MKRELIAGASILAAAIPFAANIDPAQAKPPKQPIKYSLGYTKSERLPNGYEQEFVEQRYIGRRLVEEIDRTKEVVTKFAGSEILRVTTTTDLDIHYTEQGPYRVITSVGGDTYSATPLD